VARSIKHERRLLSTDELTLVEKSHHPVPDHDLKELRKLVRERRPSTPAIPALLMKRLRRHP
jgi:hypothetical protein